MSGNGNGNDFFGIKLSNTHFLLERMDLQLKWYMYFNHNVCVSPEVEICTINMMFI